MALAVGLLLLVMTILVFFLRSPKDPSDRTGTRLGPDRAPAPEIVPGIASGTIDREPAPAEISTADKLVEILVVDEVERTPLESVSVFVAQEGRHVFLGHTNAEGTLRTPLPDSGGFMVRALASGKAQWSRWLTAPIADRLLIELSDGNSLHGRVLGQDGRSAGQGVQVVAWAGDEYTTLTSVQRWIDEGQASFPTAVTDQNGEFELNELHAGKNYEICAGIDGLLAKSIYAQAGDENVILTLGTLYAAIIQIRDSEGLLPDLRFPFPGFSISYSHEMFESAYQSYSPQLLLAGVDVSNQLQTPEFDQGYFFLKNSNERNLGPIPYYLNFPGYADEEAEIFVSRVADGISLYRLRLTPVARSTGTIEFAFSGSTKSIKNPPGLFRSMASLFLTDSSDQIYEYFVPDFDKPLRITNMPHGEYSYRMTLYNQILGDGPWAGSVDHRGVSTTVPISISQFGTMDITVLEGTREQLHSKILIQLVPQFPGQKALFNFQYPPYRIEGVPAGDYIVRLIPPQGDALAMESPIVTVRAGETSVQTFTLSD